MSLTTVIGKMKAMNGSKAGLQVCSKALKPAEQAMPLISVDRT